LNYTVATSSSTAKVVYLLHHPESEHLYVGKSERSPGYRAKMSEITTERCRDPEVAEHRAKGREIWRGKQAT